MALFSKEFIELNPIFEQYDFSILEIGEKLFNEQSHDIICEGFGIVGITKRDNKIFVDVLLLGIIKQVEFIEFIDNYKKTSI